MIDALTVGRPIGPIARTAAASAVTTVGGIRSYKKA